MIRVEVMLFGSERVWPTLRLFVWFNVGTCRNFQQSRHGPSPCALVSDRTFISKLYFTQFKVFYFIFHKIFIYYNAFVMNVGIGRGA